MTDARQRAKRIIHKDCSDNDEYFELVTIAYDWLQKFITDHLAALIRFITITQGLAINRYLQRIQRNYEERLEKYSIPPFHKKKCFGTIELTDLMLTNVNIKHLHASLRGSYKHNLLFIKNNGEFQQDIDDLSATLGPLVPISIGGIPYLNEEILCNIRHTKNSIKLDGGILRWLAKRRLTHAMRFLEFGGHLFFREKMMMREGGIDALCSRLLLFSFLASVQLFVSLNRRSDRILCDSLVEVLDGNIRESLKGVQFVIPVNEAISISYLMVDQPLALPRGDFRNLIINDGQLHMSCRKAAITVRNMGVMNTANLLLTILLRYDGGDVKNDRKELHTVSLLYRSGSNRLRILFRLKSEVVTGNHHHLSYNDQMFSVISEVMRSHVTVPLPVPIDAQTERSMVKLPT
ncbi:hypothetical protein KIN20_012566 [Parelaphostrongylus tenuis]|uniref:Uncharacterized protein n=1 Tax=Parelaphostrongylus tenuis TaxID=148309 RepID=A0AAD5QMW2_PARTN|nr:hypothetical protein KIN20_012566 [Parelaphostrongylus tenuis]